MDKIITIAGRQVGFRATALTPRLYRHRMGRDIIRDLNQLRRSFSKAASLSKDATAEEREEAQLSMLDLEIFENIAWLMARQYDPHRPGQPGGVAGGLFHVLHLHDHAGDPGTLERQPAHYRKA